MPKPKSVVVATRVDRETAGRLSALAESRDQTVSAFLCDLVRSATEPSPVASFADALVAEVNARRRTMTIEEGAIALAECERAELEAIAQAVRDIGPYGLRNCMEGAAVAHELVRAEAVLRLMRAMGAIWGGPGSYHDKIVIGAAQLLEDTRAHGDKLLADAVRRSMAKEA